MNFVLCPQAQYMYIYLIWSLIILKIAHIIGLVYLLKGI